MSTGSGKRRLVTRWIQDFDRDGLTEEFAILLETDDLERAKAVLPAEAQRFVAKALSGNPGWKRLDIDLGARPSSSDPNKSNAVVHSLAAMVGDGTGFNSMKLYLDVVEIPAGISVDAELFNPAGCRFEVETFFKAQTGPRPAAQLAQFFALNGRPVKFVPTSEGGLDVQALDMRTGVFQRDMSCLSRCVSGYGDVDEFRDEAAFEVLVAQIRRHLACASGG